MTQSQSGGIGSKNLQVQTMHVGLSFGDARTLFMDLFEANFNKTRDVAKEIANERAAQLRDELFTKLDELQVGDLQAFNQPEKQSALIDAQKAIALSGDEELRGMLVNAIATIAFEPERSLKSIVLQEAIKVMPSLTKRQLAAITLSFLVRSVVFFGVMNGKQYFELIRHAIGNDLDVLDFTEGDFRHIEYCRCGIVEMGGVEFGDVFTKVYPGLVSKGYTQEEVDARLNGAFTLGAIIPCEHAPSRFRVVTPNIHSLEANAAKLNLTPSMLEQLKQMLADNLLSAAEVDSWILQQGDFAETLSTRWRETSLQSLKLTSVGMAVGHSFAQLNNSNLNDLSIWL